MKYHSFLPFCQARLENSQMCSIFIDRYNRSIWSYGSVDWYALVVSQRNCGGVVQLSDIKLWTESFLWRNMVLTRLLHHRKYASRNDFTSILENLYHMDTVYNSRDPLVVCSERCHSPAQTDLSTKFQTILAPHFSTIVCTWIHLVRNSATLDARLLDLPFGTRKTIRHLR